MHRVGIAADHHRHRNTEKKGSHSRQRHKRIHIRSARKQRNKSARKIVRPDAKHRRAKGKLRKRKAIGAFRHRKERGDGNARKKHLPHRDIHEHPRQNQRHNQGGSSLFRFIFFFYQGLVFGFFFYMKRSCKARFFHLCNDFFGIAKLAFIRDRHRRKQQIHFAKGHTFKLSNHSFDRRGTSSAMHSANIIPFSYVHMLSLRFISLLLYLFFARFVKKRKKDTLRVF